MIAATELAAHVAALARAFNVHLEVHEGLSPSGAFAATTTCGKRCVIIHPVIDESTYAVALHELGHQVAPCGSYPVSEFSATYRATGRFGSGRDVRLQLDEERAAWEWARAHALVWTDLMQRVRDIGIASYERSALRVLGHVPGVVACPRCQQRNRLPTAGAARCARCRGPLDAAIPRASRGGKR